MCLCRDITKNKFSLLHEAKPSSTYSLPRQFCSWSQKGLFFVFVNHDKISLIVDTVDGWKKYGDDWNMFWHSDKKAPNISWSMYKQVYETTKEKEEEE